MPFMENSVRSEIQIPLSQTFRSAFGYYQQHPYDALAAEIKVSKARAQAFIGLIETYATSRNVHVDTVTPLWTTFLQGVRARISNPFPVGLTSQQAEGRQIDSVTPALKQGFQLVETLAAARSYPLNPTQVINGLVRASEQLDKLREEVGLDQEVYGHPNTFYPFPRAMLLAVHQAAEAAKEDAKQIRDPESSIWTNPFIETLLGRSLGRELRGS
jgi:hypothetical protein